MALRLRRSRTPVRGVSSCGKVAVITLRPLRSLALVFAAYAVAVLFLLVVSAPLRPRTALGWILFIVVGPPLAVALEWLGERFTSVPGAAAIVRGTARRRLSVLRIAYLAVWFLILLGATLGSIYLLSRLFPGLEAFFSRHFG